MSIKRKPCIAAESSSLEEVSISSFVLERSCGFLGKTCEDKLSDDDDRVSVSSSRSSRFSR